MNTFVIAIFASLAVLTAAKPSGIHGIGSVVSGPSGIVTDHGAIGPAGVGLGWGHGGAVLAAPAAVGVVAAPALAVGHGIGLGGLGWGGLGLGGIGLGHGVGVGLGHGVGVITNGGGTIGIGHGGVAVRGPPTAPAVIAGPSGKVVADGLWGPTLAGGAGHGGHGW